MRDYRLLSPAEAIAPKNEAASATTMVLESNHKASQKIADSSPSLPLTTSMYNEIRVLGALLHVVPHRITNNVDFEIVLSGPLQSSL